VLPCTYAFTETSVSWLGLAQVEARGPA